MSYPTLLRAFAVVSSLAGVLAVAGCGSSVESTTEGGGGADGGADSGAGGGEACTAYEGPCQPGATHSCGGCIPEPGGQVCGSQACKVLAGCQTEWDVCNGPNTPLVLSFEGGAVEYQADREHTFDVSGLASLVTDWPTARTPWLALDRDRSGAVEDGGELFGSLTRLASGRRATNGFEALRELDADNDGRLTAADPAFAQLLVWADATGDRRSSPSELRSLTELGVVSIELGYRSEPRCDARGNCEVERASFQFRNASGALRTGEVIDVHLATQR